MSHAFETVFSKLANRAMGRPERSHRPSGLPKGDIERRVLECLTHVPLKRSRIATLTNLTLDQVEQALQRLRHHGGALRVGTTNHNSKWRLA